MVAAEADGQPSVGLAHFIDYLEALEAGRIDGKAVAEITRPAPAIILSDAKGGAAHPGFDAAFELIVEAASEFGLALFTQKNAYTCGALGYFAGRLAGKGLAAIAATNGPALLAGSGSTRPVYCTNPMAFAAPVAGGPPLIIDQSSSATAFVNIRAAAKAGKPIPEGWALDAEGQPTTDARQAVKGALLAFGGAARRQHRADGRGAGGGSQRRQMVARRAILHAAARESPGSGLTVIAIAPRLVDPGFEIRLAAQLDRLSGQGVHIPGRSKGIARATAEAAGVSIPRAVYERIAARNR